MKLIQVGVALVCFCWMSSGQCSGRMRTLVPVSNSQLVTRSNAANQNHEDILVLGGAENIKCEACGRTTNGCSCNGNKNCGCSFINSEEIIMKLINALIITTVNNNNHLYPHPHYPHAYGSGGNLVDLGLLQTGGNGGLDALNLGLGGQGVLGVNLGGGGSSAHGKGHCGCGSSGGGAGFHGGSNDLLNINVLQKDLLSGSTC